MPKILIVEDELPIADLIRLTLKSAGYLCDHAPDGDQAADLAAAGNYDLALVDVMLPRTDGFTLLEYFQSLELPVIFVTARSAVADRVKGLKLGAEDYIVKPFDVAELLARVETVLRRFHKTEETLSLAGVRVDPRARKVWRGEEEVSLTPKEYDLLLLFFTTPTPPSTGTPFMNGSGAENWPTAAKPWTCTSSVCGKKWAGKRRCRL